jgi:hypothetical protein
VTGYKLDDQSSTLDRSYYLPQNTHKDTNENARSIIYAKTNVKKYIDIYIENFAEQFPRELCVTQRISLVFMFSYSRYIYTAEI